MQRKSFEECKQLFVNALHTSNWNDVANWATELLKYDRNQPWVWANRGAAFIKLGFPLDAILNLEKALEIEQNPVERAGYYSNIGAAHWDMKEADKAISSLKRAISLEPFSASYLTLGNIYKHQGRIKDALEAYKQCITLDPDNADGHLVYGMALLSVGNLQEGWREYEWRWKTSQLPPRRLKAPQWNGEDLTNKTILVYGEQGLGDIIQFGRYIRELANRFPRAKIIAEVRQPLKRLFETIPESYATINAGERLPVIDYGVPMLTLAGMLTPNVGSIPAVRHEYLLKTEDIDRWGEKFEQLPEGFRVGVCWSGMARTANPEANAVDLVRSTELATFAKLAKIPGIIWVSLQKGPPAEQVKTPPSGMTIADFTDEMHDFYETCCAARNCDLVISVDTAVVHAAASVGVPTWLLSRWDGCWRWLGNREDSPWYPSLKQFVQPAPEDWAGMMDKVAKELSELVRNKAEPELDLTLVK